MKTLLSSLLSAVILAAPLRAANAPKPAPAPAAKADNPTASAPAKDGFKSDDERAVYALGYQIGRNVGPFGFTTAELKILETGLRDSALNKPAAVNVGLFAPRVNELLDKRMAAAASAEKAAGKAFAEKFAREEGVKPIPNGGWYKVLQEGGGSVPTAEDTVKVHYRGTLRDDTEFDSSYSRNEPATFPLKGVIPCWTNGVAQMKVGGKAKLVCPSDAAYGDAGRRPTIKGGATLIFEVELLEIVKLEAPKTADKPAKK